MTDVKMLKSVSKSLLNMPAYVYVAGFIGAAATYVLYTPASSSSSKSSKLLRNPTFKNRCPRGLINYGSDCFVNVIMQSLAASSKVTDWLVQMKANNKPAPSGQDPAQTEPSAAKGVLFDTLFKTVARLNKYDLTSEALAGLLAQYADGFDEACQEFYAARDVKGALSLHKWSIRSEEHDCHELFHVIMDALEEEEKENRLSMSSLNYFASRSSQESGSSKSGAIKNPFLGYMATQLECLDCGYKYPLRLESFYSLSLSLPQQKHLIAHEISLIDCINEFFKTEFIGDMKCEKCSTEGNANAAASGGGKATGTRTASKKGFLKRQAIAKLPECLCIQLQRNSWSDALVKQSRHVQFPLSIRIDDISSVAGGNSAQQTSFSPKGPESFSLKHVGLNGLISKKSSKLKSFLFDKHSGKASASSGAAQSSSYYDLKSAIVHYGNAHSGHFIQFRQLLEPAALARHAETSSIASTSSSQLSSGKSPKASDETSSPTPSTSKPAKSTWLQISDSDIKTCKLYDLLSNNVYMLFYDRVTTVGFASAPAAAAAVQ